MTATNGELISIYLFVISTYLPFHMFSEHCC